MSCTKLEDLTGQRFGKIIVLGYSHHKHNYDYYYCTCLCSIGKGKIYVFLIKGVELRQGRINSCGCNCKDKPQKQPPISYMDLKEKIINPESADEEGAMHIYSWVIGKGIEESGNGECIGKSSGFISFNCFVEKSGYTKSLFPELFRNRNLRNCKKTADNLEYTIGDIDLMPPFDFENIISYIFQKMGYFTQVTSQTGDQGIDVIAKKNSNKFGIQVKCYDPSNLVTNKAIQEVVAGLSHYKLDQGIVITNSYFTSSAKELAKSNNIILWDRKMLMEKIAELL